MCLRHMGYSQALFFAPLKLHFISFELLLLLLLLLGLLLYCVQMKLSIFWSDGRLVYIVFQWFLSYFSRLILRVSCWLLFRQCGEWESQVVWTSQPKYNWLQNAFRNLHQTLYEAGQSKAKIVSTRYCFSCKIQYTASILNKISSVVHFNSEKGVSECEKKRQPNAVVNALAISSRASFLSFLLAFLYGHFFFHAVFCCFFFSISTLFIIIAATVILFVFFTFRFNFQPFWFSFSLSPVRLLNGCLIGFWSSNVVSTVITVSFGYKYVSVFEVSMFYS